MIRIISIIVGVLLLGYFFIAGFYFRKDRNNRLCTEVEVVIKDSLEEYFVGERELHEILRKKGIYPVKKKFASINTEEIEKAVLSNEMVANAEVYKTPSGIIKLEIEQKMPILRVMGVKGNYYVDHRGKIMPISFRYVANVPIATGYVEKEFAKSDLYKFALFLQENDFWNDLIVQIVVDENYDVILIPRVGNCRILLGTLSDFEEKLDKLMLFYKQVVPKMGWDKYSMINLKFKNQIVCTKK